MIFSSVLDLGSYVSTKTAPSKKTINQKFILLVVNIMLRYGQLVRVHQTTHTIFDTENVIVDRVDGILEARRLTDNASRIKAGEVEGPRGLELGRVQAEGEGVQRRIRLSVGGMVVGRRRRVVGIDELEVSHISTVDLKLDTVGRRVDTVSSDVARGEELHGVVEVQLLGTTKRRQGLLDLGNQDRTGVTGEEFTLIGVQVDVVGVTLDTTDRAVNVGMRLPPDPELDIVVLKSHEGEGGLPVLTEGETKGVELGGSGAIVEFTSDGLGETGREKVGGDVVGEEGILVIDDLTTDEELNLVDHGRPVEGLTGVGGVVDRGEVGVAEEITLTLEANGGHTTLGESTLNDLTLDSLGEVRVATVGGTEEAHLGITDEVGILSTDSDELGDTTRHFILYGEFIFKLTKPKVSIDLDTSDFVTWDEDLIKLVFDKVSVYM
jgi:hypothetical protein